MQISHRSWRYDEIDELGCPQRPPPQTEMQTGEIVTFCLGLFAILMVLAVLLYYRYCKKKSRLDGIVERSRPSMKVRATLSPGP
ncbi:hypothetical protein AB6A40_002675 [Gnathostoma spinigerum]|uniref:Uncharacterized protein n=1 Tax=Gnathostoma spinigerum TaxID=75299 RepID=A0ABD6E8M6_9BILA